MNANTRIDWDKIWNSPDKPMTVEDIQRIIEEHYNKIEEATLEEEMKPKSVG
jgi:hypothetical protein